MALLVSTISPPMIAIRMPAIAPPAMYPEDSNTPGLLSVSATNWSSVISTCANSFRARQSTNHLTMPPMKIGADDASGR